MHLISNQQRREIIDFLTAFVEMKADNSNKTFNQKRRAGRLIKKLQKNEEIDLEIVKAVKDEVKNRQRITNREG